MLLNADKVIGYRVAQSRDDWLGEKEGGRAGGGRRKGREEGRG